MTWLVWRQNRVSYVWLGVALGVIGVFIVVTGLAMRGFEGGIDCLRINANPSCGGQGDFQREFGALLTVNGWFNLLPALVGIFVGAPLLAREFEHGTHRLVWTQGISRTRWLSAQLGAVLAVVVATGVVIAVGMTWWRAPWDVINSRFDPLGYDFEGLMPFATLLLAASIGVVAGTALRRTVPAMAAALGGFLAVRLPVEFLARAHFLTPLTMTLSGPGKSGAPDGAWVLDTGLLDAAGNRVSTVVIPADCPNDLTSLNACLGAHGIRNVVTYQPADRFWALQSIEAGIYVAIAIVCIAVTVWWVRRRAR